ncbi:MAG: AAA family ATPase [Actinomycetia bacterium]|nr:AAA family ATPase [Actinomycetes bacterium]
MNEAQLELAIPLVVAAMLAITAYVAIGRSPHTVVRADDLPVRLSDVVGASTTKREVVDTLRLFLNHVTFRQQMGGSARRGVLLEGPPGTGKTFIAKALAAEAGVPFLSVSANAFESMFVGQTNRKLRNYFKALRRAARSKGGAIGFIDEFDAIGAARGRDGAAGVVFELLVQLQSFGAPSPRRKLIGGIAHHLNRVLPGKLALRRPAANEANVLVIAATNRAADLDPALMRPGRFDRTIHFDLPPRNDRLEIAEYYLARKSHELSVSAALVADLTAGYTPVRIERLLDEALIVALREGRVSMRYHDVIAAQLITEVGLAQEVGYHPDERRRVAIHEAGHALTAALAGRDVKLASILRRSGAIGLVAHDEVDERYLQTPSEARDVMMVALAGRAAEIQEFGEASSGVANDLHVATTIAAELVGMLGSSDSLLSLDAAQNSTGGNLVAKVFQDTTARAKADELMNAAADRAACAVLEHRRALLALADALVEQDELSGDEVHIIVAGALTT